MVLVVMGVSGSGKSTIGKLLSDRLGVPFADADDYHPQSNIEKMKAGIPLNDNDRYPWLQKLAQLISDHQKPGLILACSALKENYRTILGSKINEELKWVYLKADPSLIAERMAKRNHFMPVALLKSQLDVLEPPSNAIVLEIKDPPEILVGHVVNSLRH